MITDDIYEEIIVSKKIVLPMNELGPNIRQTLTTYLQKHYEGHCEVGGYVKKYSTNILSYSSGCIVNGNELAFDILFQCLVCLPIFGMTLTCQVKSIIKAGIRCECLGEQPSPFVAHIAKETCQGKEMEQYYNSLTENSIIQLCVLGQRFELYDNYISVIAELLPV
jgi:DNA-directed RNA polymerase subunit E'/Rpb7